MIVPVAGKPAVEPTVNVPPVAGVPVATAAAVTVFLNSSLKSLIIPSVNDTNETAVSSTILLELKSVLEIVISLVDVSVAE